MVQETGEQLIPSILNSRKNAGPEERSASAVGILTSRTTRCRLGIHCELRMSDLGLHLSEGALVHMMS